MGSPSHGKVRGIWGPSHAEVHIFLVKSPNEVKSESTKKKNQDVSAIAGKSEFRTHFHQSFGHMSISIFRVLS